MPQKTKSELQFFSKQSREPIYDKRLARRVIFMAHLKLGSLILDAGCGEGYWGRMFANHGYKVVGIDLSKEVIKRATKKAVPGQSFLVGNLLNRLPTKKDFDGIICGCILHHFPDKNDLNMVFYNLASCLKHNGKIILVEPNGSNPIVNISRKVGRFLVHHYPQDIATENETMHSIKTYLNLLEKNSFRVLKIESYHHDMSRKIKNKNFLINFLSKIRSMLFNAIWVIFPEPYRGNEIIIIAQKL